MNELKLTNVNGIEAVDSRQVAEATGKNHANMMREIRTYCGYLGEINIDCTDFFIESTYTTEQNKTMPCYLITRKGCEMIANKMTGQKGVAFTAMYINAFHKMEQQIQIMLDSYMIDDPVKRAERWIEEQKEKQALETTVAVQNQRIEEMRPKEIFADALTTSDKSILVGDLAKILKQNGVDTGQKRLFSWLRDNNYLIRSGSSYNLPTQRSMNLELFEVKETPVIHSDGHITVSFTIKVTGKGQQYFINKFLGYAGRKKVKK
ncbi:MAG: phage antirepressor KilAC domain-containing protein [Oscillospiraceae bacterium]|nr:phage antirepressor KilAC domain-containing protein [Oscillospiraceae bacterium]